MLEGSNTQEDLELLNCLAAFNTEHQQLEVVQLSAKIEIFILIFFSFWAAQWFHHSKKAAGSSPGWGT